MLLPQPPESFAENDRTSSEFAGKFQQVTAPVTAKGVEDTTFYIYNRLISLNEVGGEPDRFGAAPGARPRLQRDATGAVARMPVASVDPRHQAERGRPGPDQRALGDARRLVGRLRQLGRAQRSATRRQVDDDGRPRRATKSTCSTRRRSAPGRSATSDARSTPSFRDRIRDYMLKAIHEAKVHTSWINPNADYDEAVRPSSPHPRRSGNSPSSTTSACSSGGSAVYGLDQRAGPDPAEAHDAGSTRHLSGDRAVGLQPGRPGQPPPRRLRATRPAAGRPPARPSRRLASTSASWPATWSPAWRTAGSSST